MKTTPHVTVIDRPCGTGKTTKLLRDLRPDRRYLIIVPLLTEVERIIGEAEVEFFQPIAEDTVTTTKLSSLIALVESGRNVVTTHKLYSALAQVAEMGMLDSYEIIIDEVPDVVKDMGTITPQSFVSVYAGDGLVTIDPDGRVRLTDKFKDNRTAYIEALKGGKTFFEEARAGCLYVLEDKLLFWALPPSLLSTGRSVTVLTYLASGSLLLPYLRKRSIDYTHDYDLQLDLSFRLKARRLIKVYSLPALEGMKWSHTAQNDTKGKAARDKAVSQALANFRKRTIPRVDLGKVILTCAKRNWFKKGKGPKEVDSLKTAGYSAKSCMFAANWLPNTTRGTNDFIHCTTALYLWDQHPNPAVMTWLNLREDPSASDRYATTELIQWLYRTAVRRGEEVQIFLAAPRMRRLLTAYLNAEDLMPGGLSTSEAA
jgi:hypothetical protein